MLSWLKSQFSPFYFLKYWHIRVTKMSINQLRIKIMSWSWCHIKVPALCYSMVPLPHMFKIRISHLYYPASSYLWVGWCRGGPEELRNNFTVAIWADLVTGSSWQKVCISCAMPSTSTLFSMWWSAEKLSKRVSRFCGWEIMLVEVLPYL